MRSDASCDDPSVDGAVGVAVLTGEQTTVVTELSLDIEEALARFWATSLLSDEVSVSVSS